MRIPLSGEIDLLLLPIPTSDMHNNTAWISIFKIKSFISVNFDCHHKSPRRERLEMGKSLRLILSCLHCLKLLQLNDMFQYQEPFCLIHNDK
ncbi:Uncharacterised protein [Kluyvera ascorbata]|nr:Uncharacterised protein [Kluyvera ascorbata]